MKLEAGFKDWTKLPSLTDLRAFDAVANAHSFSAAARMLNVTHAAVALQVKGLEDHLGVQLAMRSPTGVTLTPQGKALAEHLQTGFAAIVEGVHSIQDSEQDRPVRVTTTAFFAEAVIFPRMTSFWGANPGAEISFLSSDDVVDIVTENIDLAICAGSGNWPGLNAELLIESPALALAAPSLVDDPDTGSDRDHAQVPIFHSSTTVEAAPGSRKICHVAQGSRAIDC